MLEPLMRKFVFASKMMPTKADWRFNRGIGAAGAKGDGLRTVKNRVDATPVGRSVNVGVGASATPKVARPDAQGEEKTETGEEGTVPTESATRLL